MNLVLWIALGAIALLWCKYWRSEINLERRWALVDECQKLLDQRAQLLDQRQTQIEEAREQVLTTIRQVLEQYAGMPKDLSAPEMYAWVRAYKGQEHKGHEYQATEH